mmetsp:Transcript_15229/g.17953  ORF Transcript_15229/g.17953 Transcript_15229/m.17953 type:complete len:219 (-) Transcript_15229:1876-2532(-)
MATAQSTKNVINLKGSTDIVCEFFDYSVNSILYQRGIYPPETFKRTTKYGLAMLMSTDENLQAYLQKILTQVRHWLMEGKVTRLVLAISGLETGENLERWVFNVEQEKALGDPAPVCEDDEPVERECTKSEKEIQGEIGAIIRQICASVTFLPLLQEECTFDLLIYCDKNAEVPTTWEETDPRYITNAVDVKLRSFTTFIHRVDTCVSYRDTMDLDDL